MVSSGARVAKDPGMNPILDQFVFVISCRIENELRFLCSLFAKFFEINSVMSLVVLDFWFRIRGR